MYAKKTQIINRTGLHARPASDFVKAAKQYTSKITIKRAEDETGANAKSIVLLLSLGLTKGTQVEISAQGEDEQAAVEALVALIEEGFGEL